MNLPNKLTLARIALTFVFMFLLFSSGIYAKSAALVVFLIACATDYFDGEIARRTGQITNFGKLMDPIADKVLTLAAFLAFVQMGIVEAWMVVIIIARELFITGVRFAAIAKGAVLAAERGGKHKTVSQIMAIFLMLVFLVTKEAAHDIWNPSMELWFKRIIFYLMLLVVILTITSGASFLKKNTKVLLGR